ncbi:Rieske (2Fe-2S) protein [Planosporangium flavigriseum]|uniref:Cytochrome bc1 complex Rieske iron-sulfur subunit n=1 Tax=Planosporangium flavigriseum TaxID=373681 RepID=A0A8J3LSV6_9ACTN|nr:Rieske (2Fe-2S) protein [Planosporangium flavigriseum]NJC65316.1 Rieske (2Fe-2S) protein [Planosporangium flavigriseum]GIG73329.1 iron-sulfur protein [Planosporangium flavigriseum]
MSETTRRNVLAGAAGVGAAAVLAACGGSNSDTGSTADTNNNAGANPAGPAAPTTAGQRQGGQQAGGSAIKTSDIPVGGGKVFTEQGVVVTQPTAGQFKAFSAKCTHAGCNVNSVSGGAINCPCHGSRFSATDGSVQAGPARSPLAAKTVTVNGDSLTIA